MTRARWLLTVLGTVLIAALWYLLLWSPTSNDIEAVHAEQETVEGQATQLRTRAAELRQVREEAPEAAATLAVAETLVPSEAALPPLLRQMQIAADEAGVRLTAVAPGRPAQLADAPGGLAAIDVNISAQGNYFQLVDVLRRLEDPSITGRGVVWRNASISISEREYPILILSMTATVFSRMDVDGIADAPAEGGEADGAEGSEASADEGPGTTQEEQPQETQPRPAESGEGGEIQ